MTAAVDRWPNLMKPSTARAYLDMGADKFRAQVVPHLAPRQVGGRLYYRRADLDRFSVGVDSDRAPGQRRDPLSLLDAVEHDLAQSPRRQSRHG